MRLYEEIKNVANVIQQTNNAELYQQLMELSTQALKMQNEIMRLTIESSTQEKEQRIERHPELYITLKDDTDKILYCSHCWDREHRLIQLKCYSSGSFKCVHCSNNGIYDKIKWNS